jgi:hypothetical protein
MQLLAATATATAGRAWHAGKGGAWPGARPGARLGARLGARHALVTAAALAALLLYWRSRPVWAGWDAEMLGPLELPEPLRASPLRSLRVAVGGLFQNNLREGGRASLERVVQLMRQSAAPFADSLLLLLENDSSDGTDAALRELCAGDASGRTLCLSLTGLRARVPALARGRAATPAAGLRQPPGGGASSSRSSSSSSINSNSNSNNPFAPQRFARMGVVRNHLLALAREQLADFDVLVVVDADMVGYAWLPERAMLAGCLAPEHEAAFAAGGPARGWHPSLVLGSLHRAAAAAAAPGGAQELSRWSAICAAGTASSVPLLYDALALRLSTSVPVALPAAARAARPGWGARDWNAALTAAHAAAQLEGAAGDAKDLHCAMGALGALEPPAGWGSFVPLDSCFGGLALYSLPALRESGCRYAVAGALDCEHVSLNDCLNKARPNSVVLDREAHVFYDSRAWERLSRRGTAHSASGGS